MEKITLACAPTVCKPSRSVKMGTFGVFEPDEYRPG